tara:strand:- start:476 stop:682 length:207 start_codon:yes stop_codon:yes gene_type:complete
MPAQPVLSTTSSNTKFVIKFTRIMDITSEQQAACPAASARTGTLQAYANRMDDSPSEEIDARTARSLF